jgi:hypothetical protein
MLFLPVREHIAVLLEDLKSVDCVQLVVDTLQHLAVKISCQICQQLMAKTCSPHWEYTTLIILVSGEL